MKICKSMASEFSVLRICRYFGITRAVSWLPKTQSSRGRSVAKKPLPSADSCCFPRIAAMADALRALKLKASVVHRTTKELDSYIVEYAENQAKVEEVRTSDDHSRLKQWENVTLETQAMIPDTANRLRSAVDDLQILVDDSPPHEQDTPEYKAATTALADATSALKRAS